MDAPKHITLLSKGTQTRKLLLGALKRNELFSGATPSQLSEMINAFRRVEIKGPTTIIRQGTDQHAFFVVESGDLDVLVTEVQRTPTRNGMATRKVVRRTATLSKGNTFGERALMEERLSGSTFKTSGPCVLWTVDKGAFNTEFLTSQSLLKRRESVNRIRVAVEDNPYFRHLQGEDGAKENVINNFFTVDFKENETVVYEGSCGDNYYIVNKGILDVYRRVDNVQTSVKPDTLATLVDGKMTTQTGKQYIKIKTLHPGDMFGELSVKFPRRVNEERIVARSNCQLYAMERSHFQQLARTGAHHLQDRFNRYASQLHPLAGQNGHFKDERAMTIDDFFKCQGSDRWSEPAQNPSSSPNINPLVDSLDEGVLEGDGGATIGLLKLLFDIANTDHITTGCEHLLDFHDYFSLNVLMAKSHSEYEIAFRMMDTNRRGVITRSQLGIMLNTIAGYRGAGAMKKLSNDQTHKEIVKKLLLDEEGPDVRYEDFQKMIESGQLPNVVAELCHAIRAESEFRTTQRGLGVAAAALTDTALSSVIAETGVSSVSIVGSMIAGGVAGALSRTFTAPLERLALLMQVAKLQREVSRGTNRASTYRGVLHGLNQIYMEGGIRSFFWGNGINILRLVPQRGISFSLFEQWKEYKLREKEEGPDGVAGAALAPPSLYSLALGGALSTAVAGAACYPLDVIRTRVTVQRGKIKNVSARSIMSNIGSVRELYQGFTPTMIKNIPEWGLNFALFEVLRRQFVSSEWSQGSQGSEHPQQFRTLRLLTCGAVTSLVSQTVVYPLETLRRNMQIALWSRTKEMGGSLGEAQAPTMITTASAIYARKGWRGFYSGLAPTYLRVVPATASGFAIYHYLLEAFR